eukprot:TRINITY_DN4414_c0_g1_i1.p1 TRINITY_DN4414_c0_g1~~TRINITY_DN4414_c0_g1_i1.p1  ORF type:complete len:343 (-),score=71.65 TRINITY_DN4414_c0_g1_i1:137-1165(-)
MWDLRTTSCVRTMAEHTGWVRHVLCDAHTIISGSFDYSIKSWDAGSGACTRTFVGHQGSVNSVAWDADGRRVVSASGDMTARVWDAATGACMYVLRGHSAEVVCLLLVDGCIVTGSDDATVRMWGDDGTCIKQLRGHTDWVTSLHTASKKRIISTSNDSTIKIWSMQDTDKSLIPVSAVVKRHSLQRTTTSVVSGEVTQPVVPPLSFIPPYKDHRRTHSSDPTSRTPTPLGSPLVPPLVSPPLQLHVSAPPSPLPSPSSPLPLSSTPTLVSSPGRPLGHSTPTKPLPPVPPLRNLPHAGDAVVAGAGVGAAVVAAHAVLSSRSITRSSSNDDLAEHIRTARS